MTARRLFSDVFVTVALQCCDITELTKKCHNIVTGTMQLLPP